MCLDRAGLLLLRLSSSYGSSGAVLYPSRPSSLPSRCISVRKFLAFFFFMFLDRVGLLLLRLSSSSGSPSAARHPSRPAYSLLAATTLYSHLFPDNYGQKVGQVSPWLGLVHPQGAAAKERKVGTCSGNGDLHSTKEGSC
jgi:hypothetical protein